MPSYTAPIKDIQFVLHDLLKVSEQDIAGYDELDRDFTSAVLEEAGKIASEVLAPLNAVGDTEGCTYENGVVRTPTGFKAAFDQMKEGGWTALDCDPEYGGQGLPYVFNTAVMEPFVSANMAFNMYQGLTHGAYSAIHAHASDELKAKFLPKMVTCALLRLLRASQRLWRLGRGPHRREQPEPFRSVRRGSERRTQPAFPCWLG